MSSLIEIHIIVKNKIKSPEKGLMIVMLDMHSLFIANDQISILTAISQTEITAKKLDLYVGLAKEKEVRDFFKKRSILMKKKADDLRKHLDRLGES